MSSPFEHCCGLQGFGQSLYDMCKACHFYHLIHKGIDEEQAKLMTEIEDYESSAVLLPHLRKFCLQKASELEAQLELEKLLNG